jgi:hypothetical protein
MPAAWRLTSRAAAQWYGDRAQRDFEKYIAIDRAAKPDRNWNRAIAPNEPGMDDIEAAARYEAKADVAGQSTLDFRTATLD